MRLVSSLSFDDNAEYRLLGRDRDRARFARLMDDGSSLFFF